MGESQTVLVTGAAGFVGRALCGALRGRRLRAVDREPFEFEAGEIVQGDLVQPGFCDEVCAGVDAVVHLAAMAGVPPSIADPHSCHRDTATTTLNLLASARKHGVRRFVFAGSAAVYGNNPEQPVKEAAVPQLLSPYAAAKLAGEAYVEAFSGLGVDGVSLRYFNVYGRGQRRESGYTGVITAFADALRAGEPLSLYGDGEQSRDFIHLSDVVRATVTALDFEGQLGGTRINIGTGRAVSIRKLGESMASLAGVDAQFDQRPERTGDVRHSCADASRAREMLGFEAEMELDDGLQEVLHG